MLQQDGDATASAQARVYALTAQISLLAKVSLNPTQGSSLDSIKSHKEVGEDFSSALTAQRWLWNVMASAPTNG